MIISLLLALKLCSIISLIINSKKAKELGP